MATQDSPLTTSDAALALLQRYGLATAFSSDAFATACAEQRPPDDDDDDDVAEDFEFIDDDDEAIEDEDEEDEAVAEVEPRPRPLDWTVVFAAMTGLYGTRGPTPVSLADGAFALDEAAADDPEVLARVREVFAGWIAAPIADELAADLDEMVGWVADVLFLRHGGPQLYVLSELRPSDEETIELYVLREQDPYQALPLGTRSYPIAPDVEAAAAGIFRYTDEVPRVYAEHVASCARCRALLFDRDRRGQLPQAYAELAAAIGPR